MLENDLDGIQKTGIAKMLNISILINLKKLAYLKKGRIEGKK